jgi:chromosome segregation ATPase
LSTRSVEEQIAYAFLWNNTDCSEIKRDITAAQQELDRANDRAKNATKDVMEARNALRLAKKVVNDADSEKRKVTEEIEILRPKVEDAPADSGLVEAYREAIAVYTPAQTGTN